MPKIIDYDEKRVMLSMFAEALLGKKLKRF